MTYDIMGPAALDYELCKYGKSNVFFRGPKRDLTKPHLAFLGGSETFGKFIKTPFPTLVEERLARACVNFGLPTAGIDVFTQSRFLADTLAQADVTVVQVLGAQNMTNRFYSVHPRRNDRFVGASALLAEIYPEVDFVDVNFTKHLISNLLEISPERFVAVLNELQEAWVARMRLLLGQIKGKSLLVWLGSTPPISQVELCQSLPGQDPAFITREMIERVRPHVTEILEVVASRQAVSSGVYGMVFRDHERAAAAEMLGPLAHEEVATALEEQLQQML